MMKHTRQANIHITTCIKLRFTHWIWMMNSLNNLPYVYYPTFATTDGMVFVTLHMVLTNEKKKYGHVNLLIHMDIY